MVRHYILSHMPQVLLCRRNSLDRRENYCKNDKFTSYKIDGVFECHQVETRKEMEDLVCELLEFRNNVSIGIKIVDSDATTATWVMLDESMPLVEFYFRRKVVENDTYRID